MKGSARRLTWLLLVMLAAVWPKSASAQFFSAVSNVSLAAPLPESLTIVLPGVSSVNFDLVPGGTASGSAPVSIQTSWLLRRARATIRVVGYFDSTDALTDPGPPSASITVDKVFGRVATGTPTTFTAFTQTIAGIGTPGASLELLSQSIGAGNRQGSRTDSLELQIDLSSDPQQPAGDYVGTLRIRAVAI